MSEFSQHQVCISGCKAPVPRELEDTRLCVLHFILSTERDCTEMRRETATEMANAIRQSEITDYIKVTAIKLSEVAIGNRPLSDDLKKRILTTFLTLMNLRDSLDRSASRNLPGLPATKSPALLSPSLSRSSLPVRLRA